MGPYLLSHHPFCDRFADHVYHFGDTQVCRGCFCLYTGLLFGVIVSILGAVLTVDIFLEWSDVERGLLIYVLVIPTVLTALLPIPRLIKDTARFALGFAMSLALVTFVITTDNFVRLFILVNYFGFYIPLSNVRNRRNKAECDGCPDKDPVTGMCPGLQTYAERKILFLHQERHGVQDAFAEDVSDLSFPDPDDLLNNE